MRMVLGVLVKSQMEDFESLLNGSPLLRLPYHFGDKNVAVGPPRLQSRGLKNRKEIPNPGSDFY